MKTVLTGIKPTGLVHIGNYLGAIKPALEYANKNNSDSKCIFFIADYHAVTTIHDSEELSYYTKSVAAAWIALGLNPDNTLLFEQSKVPEIMELNWLLACLAPKGLMNRAHAYKAKVADNRKNERGDDYNVNMGLYTYPLLMSADILLFESDIVPVGKDQIQHVEIARDLAEGFNRRYGNILKLPTYQTKKDVESILGKDGRKMSKSYDNTVFIFSESKKIKKYIYGIKTNSQSPNEEKDPSTSELFKLYKQFANEDEINELELRYRAGIGWGEVKNILYNKIEEEIHESRDYYNHLMSNQEILNEILEKGAVKAREIAKPVLKRVKKAIGVL